MDSRTLFGEFTPRKYVHPRYSEVKNCFSTPSERVDIEFKMYNENGFCCKNDIHLDPGSVLR
jgi:hypothetical protein